MAEEAASLHLGTIEAEDEKHLVNLPSGVAKTRFKTQSGACDLIAKTGDVWRDAALIVHGKKTTLADCATALQRDDDKAKFGVRARNFVAIVSDPVTRANMAATAVKYNTLVSPLHGEHERGKHCALSTVSGPFGSVAMALRRWKTSLIRINLAPIRIRMEERLSEHDANKRECAVSDTFPRLCALLRDFDGTHLQLLRKNVWGRSLSLLDDSANMVFYQKLVRWQTQTLDEYKRRLAHEIESLRAHVWGSARQWTFVCVADVEIEVGRHKRMLESFKNNHPCFDRWELTRRGCYDIIMRDFAPLEDRPHRLPLFATALETETARRALKMWDAMDSEERLCHPPAIQALFDDPTLRSEYAAFAEGRVNPRTGMRFPTRHAGGRPSPTLEKHLYGVGGVLMKSNSMDREQKFSIISNYTSSATNASNERLTAQLSLANEYPSEVQVHAHAPAQATRAYKPYSCTRARTHTRSHTHAHTRAGVSRSCEGRAEACAYAGQLLPGQVKPCRPELLATKVQGSDRSAGDHGAARRDHGAVGGAALCGGAGAVQI